MTITPSEASATTPSAPSRTPVTTSAARPRRRIPRFYWALLAIADLGRGSGAAEEVHGDGRELQPRAPLHVEDAERLARLALQAQQLGEFVLRALGKGIERNLHALHQLAQCSLLRQGIYRQSTVK